VLLRVGKPPPTKEEIIHILEDSTEIKGEGDGTPLQYSSEPHPYLQRGIRRPDAPFLPHFPNTFK